MVEVEGKVIPLLLHELYLPVLYGIHTWEEVCQMYDYELEVALQYVEVKRSIMQGIVDGLTQM